MEPDSSPLFHCYQCRTYRPIDERALGLSSARDCCLGCYLRLTDAPPSPRVGHFVEQDVRDVLKEYAAFLD